MNNKINIRKKILFGLAISITCCSLTGCLEPEEQGSVPSAQPNKVESLQKKISKTVDAVVYKQLKEEKEKTNRKAAKVKKTIKLKVEKDVYTSKSKKIIYTIKNTTGKKQKVVLAPRLERKTKDGYEDVPCITGFCGVADPLKSELEGSVLLEWYPNLSSGTYRISFQAKKNTKKGWKDMIIKDTFEYKE